MTAERNVPLFLEQIMYLYVYEDYTGGRDLSEDLIRRSYERYTTEECFNSEEPCGMILRTEKGKPYFEMGSIQFSVSHTGKLWVCLMGTEPVGVDVQEVRHHRTEKIAQRYYTQDEQEYIEGKHRSFFYQIWARKEAYAKYTGEGLSRELNKFSTLREQDVIFVDVELRPEVKASCCMREKEVIWIRNLV